MVGVAGRSKACGTCRSRRIRCTQERPQCSNCIRSNRFCSGYVRETVFIVNQARHPGTLPKPKTSHEDSGKHSKPARASQRATDQQNVPFWKQRLTHNHSKIRKARDTDVLTITLLSPSPSTNPSPLPLHRQQLLALYLDSTMPSSSDFGAGPQPWVYYLAQLPYHPPCLAAAIDALVLSNLSRIAGAASPLFPASPSSESTASSRTMIATATESGGANAEVLRARSLQLYTAALSRLQNALYSPSQMYADTTLAACLVLALFEILECPGGDRVGYLAHQGGAARLIRGRGAAAHRRRAAEDGDGGQGGFAHALFSAFRTQGILAALERHERNCFLAEREWCVVPYEIESGDEGEDKASVQVTARKEKGEEIWDFIAMAPGVLARTDEMQRAEPVRSLCIALEVLQYCWDTDAELDAWWEGLKESYGGVVCWPVLTAETDAAETVTEGGEHRESIFPVRFEFQNLRVAIILMSYWGLLTIVYNGMMLLYQVLQAVPVDRKAVKALGSRAPFALLRGIQVDCPPDCACGGEPDVPCIVRFDISTMPPLGHRADFMTPVRNICQSVQYCEQPKMKGLGWSCIISPLSIAVDVIKKYEPCRREREWMIDVLMSKTVELPYLKNIWWAQERLTRQAEGWLGSLQEG